MFRGLSFPLRPLTVETHLANAQSGDVMGLNGDWTSGYHNIEKELGYWKTHSWCNYNGAQIFWCYISTTDGTKILQIATAQKIIKTIC